MLTFFYCYEHFLGDGLGGCPAPLAGFGLASANWEEVRGGMAMEGAVLIPLTLRHATRMASTILKSILFYGCHRTFSLSG